MTEEGIKGYRPKKRPDLFLYEILEEVRASRQEIKGEIKEMSIQVTTLQGDIGHLKLLTSGDPAAGIDGYGVRLQKLESWKSKMNKYIGVAGGFFFIIGAAVGWIFKLIKTGFHHAN